MGGKARQLSMGEVCMKALTLTQPWASLVVLGEKHCETRSWRTSHHGRLAIHAAATQRYGAKSMERISPFRELLEKHDVIDLPLGGIVGFVTLVTCWRTDMTERVAMLTEQERRLGDFGVGRWVWELTEPVALTAPIYCMGALGVWEWPGEEQVRV